MYTEEKHPKEGMRWSHGVALLEIIRGSVHNLSLSGPSTRPLGARSKKTGSPLERHPSTGAQVR